MIKCEIYGNHGLYVGKVTLFVSGSCEGTAKQEGWMQGYCEGESGLHWAAHSRFVVTAQSMSMLIDCECSMIL